MKAKITFYKEEKFKETPIGKTPEDWEISELKDIANIESGNTAPQGEKYFQNGKYPFIRMQHLNILEEDKYPIIFDLINEHAVKEKRLKLFKKGSLLLAKSGESIRTEKKAILKFDSYVVNHLAVIEIKKKYKVDNLFLFYFFKRFKLSSLLTQTTTPSINLSTLKKIKIPLPLLPEQKAIAHALSIVDEAIQKTNEIIEKTMRLKKGLMQELLTRGIGNKEFKDTEIGRIPKEWEVVRLSTITLSIKDGTHNPPKRVKKGIPLLSARNIINGKIVRLPEDTYISKEDYEALSKRHEIRKRDVLLTIVGTIGNSAVIKKEPNFAVQRSVAIIRPNNKFVLSDFLHVIFQSSNFQKQLFARIKLTTQAGVYLSELGKILVPLLPIEEQQRIVEILSTVDKRLEIERKRKEKLERIKKTLMDLLLTGKIRVKVIT